MSILLVIPPMVQSNTPYPSTPQLTAFLRSRQIEAHQFDASQELVLRLFTRRGLTMVRDEMIANLASGKVQRTESTDFFLEFFEDHARVVEPFMAYLERQDETLAWRIVTHAFLPMRPRPDVGRHSFLMIDWFGRLGLHDQARYLGGLYLADLIAGIRDGVDNGFLFYCYGDTLASSQPSFDYMQAAIRSVRSTVTDLIDEMIDGLVERYRPRLVGFSCPFPGTAFGAFRLARRLRERHPEVRTVLGGGWVNTELRDLTDPRVFDYMDYVTYDDGEAPLLRLWEHLEGRAPESSLLRTRLRRDGEVVLVSDPAARDLAWTSRPAPTTDGLPVERYISIFDQPTYTYRLWNESRWNKLALAHGCYWRKCSFCDVDLDYIQRYEPDTADAVIGRMEAMAAETGCKGFHFVDEAAPPAMLRQLSQRLLDRGLTFTWWGNIRFEKAFTPDLARLMASAGCVAASGGFEALHPRLLARCNKGVTLPQMIRAAAALSAAGIHVHAYLIYGFPTQTAQETVDSLELARQLFIEKVLRSAHWHRLVVTAHSPMARDPASFGITLKPFPPSAHGMFARNLIPHEDPTDCDHQALGAALVAAVEQYQNWMGLDWDVSEWFKTPVPRPTIPGNYVYRLLNDEEWEGALEGEEGGAGA